MASRDLSSGAIRGHLLRMSGFMLLTMLIQTLYGLVDLFWVGQLGRDAVAAVALGSNLMMALMALAQVLAVGTAALVAQAAGRRDVAQVRALFTQSLGVSVLAAIVLVLFLWALSGRYSEGLAGNQQVAMLTREFLLPFIPSLGLQLPMFVLSAALRGVGDVRSASLVQIGTVLINIVLAPVLIFGWGTGHAYGIAGAALASGIAVASGLLVLVVLVIRKGRYLTLEPAAWRPQPRIWLRIAGIGLPSGTEFALLALYFGFIMAMLRGFGPAPQAAFGIGMRIFQVGMMPTMALSFAATAIVGQNFGAGHYARISETFRTALRLGLMSAALFCVLFHIAPTLLIAPFSADPQVQAYGAEYLRWITWNLLAMAVVSACGGVFSGLGNTRPQLLASAIRMGFVVVSSLLLADHAGFAPHWLWAASLIASILQLLINLMFVRRDLRRCRQQLQPSTAAAAPVIDIPA